MGWILYKLGWIVCLLRRPWCSHEDVDVPYNIWEIPPNAMVTVRCSWCRKKMQMNAARLQDELLVTEWGCDSVFSTG